MEQLGCHPKPLSGAVRGVFPANGPEMRRNKSLPSETSAGSSEPRESLPGLTDYCVSRWLACDFIFKLVDTLPSPFPRMEAALSQFAARY